MLVQGHYGVAFASQDGFAIARMRHRRGYMQILGLFVY